MKKKEKKESFEKKFFWFRVKMFFGILAIMAAVFYLYNEYVKTPLPEPIPTTKPATTPLIPALPTAPKGETIVLKTASQADTTIVFMLQAEDACVETEFRNNSNSVLIWRSRHGAIYQIISHQKQDWTIQGYKGGEFIFENGKKLTVKFSNNERSFMAPLNPRPFKKN